VLCGIAGSPRFAGRAFCFRSTDPSDARSKSNRLALDGSDGYGRGCDSGCPRHSLGHETGFIAARTANPNYAARPGRSSLAELARFDPPTYTPAVLRGAQDEAMRKFRAAMKHYRQGEYARAITGLREAAKLNPKDAGALFFLGVSYLLSGQTDDGIAALQQSVALGDTPYLEDAHYYLAKAFLHKNDLAGAEAELQKTVQLKGDLESKAQELAQSIQALHRPSH
jgi:tetratricopeptide (TPR) repeat protein